MMEEPDRGAETLKLVEDSIVPGFTGEYVFPPVPGPVSGRLHGDGPSPDARGRRLRSYLRRLDR